MQTNRLLPFLQLFRIPNVFTAIADVSMGYLFVHASLRPWSVYASLLAASCLLYTAGMVLNDVYDRALDARDRPHRPLPSGQISARLAGSVGYGMLFVGLASGWIAGAISDDLGIVWWRSGLVATALAGSVVAYDAVLKATWAGPLVMGACRALNVLLGMSAGGPIDPNVTQWYGYDAAQLLVACGIGAFIVGVTWFARTEARVSDRRQLVSAVLVMVAAFWLLAIFPQFGAFASGAAELTMRPAVVWPLLVLLLGYSIVRRCWSAIADPVPMRVQAAVKQCIVSLIVLDAAVCLAVRSPVWWSVGILALIGPMLLLGRWVYST
jgi:4-hydroxybenzoate polyprenyltransferase